MTELPGKVGKSYPAINGNQSNGNAPSAQVSINGERYGWIIALIIGLIAIVAVAFLFAVIRSIGTDLENVRGLIENSAAAASQSASQAAVAADRADRAERRAGLAEAYGKQVYVELNRLGYPVRTPIEEHEPLPGGKQ